MYCAAVEKRAAHYGQMARGGMGDYNSGPDVVRCECDRGGGEADCYYYIYKVSGDR